MYYKVKVRLATLTALCCVFYSTLHAQVTIGDDKLPEVFSVLQLESKYSSNQYGGLRMPRLSTQERNQLLTTTADKTEAAGLMIYNTSKDCMEYWDGKKWVPDANCCPKTVQDAEGNVYTASLFGEAGCWMTQNLRSTQYADGTQLVESIQAGTDPDAQFYAYPNNDASLLATSPEYGLLYTWAAASSKTASDLVASSTAGNIVSNVQGICPEGWVLPSDKDWSDLEKEIANFSVQYSSHSAMKWKAEWGAQEGLFRGTHSKSMKSSRIITGLTNGLSESAQSGGFDGLLVGIVENQAIKVYGEQAFYWTSSEESVQKAWHRGLLNYYDEMYRGIPEKSLYLSVRCKKQEN